jgi:hypothetical protein
LAFGHCKFHAKSTSTFIRTFTRWSTPNPPSLGRVAFNWAAGRDADFLLCQSWQTGPFRLVENDNADWELYDLHFFFPCEVCLQETRKGKK